MARHSISYQDIVIEQSINLTEESRPEIALKDMSSSNKKILPIKPSRQLHSNRLQSTHKLKTYSLHRDRF